MTKSLRAGSLIFSFVIFTLLGVAWLQRQNLYDWWRLRDFNPPAQIVQLASEITMNYSTRRIFYVQHPQIDDKASFNSHFDNH